VIATGTLNRGAAQITVTEDLAVGRHTLVAAYLGDDNNEPSQGSFSVNVRP
jgi:hypothetical protein